MIMYMPAQEDKSHLTGGASEEQLRAGERERSSLLDQVTVHVLLRSSERGGGMWPVANLQKLILKLYSLFFVI